MKRSIKKISVKTVVGSMKSVLAAGADGGGLMRVIGRVTSVKSGESTYGKWTGLLGQFEATNLLSGEVFESSVCLLPDVILNKILVALEDVDTLDFAADIGFRRTDDARDGGSGYEYYATPLMDDASDPLEGLRRKAAQFELPKPALFLEARTEKEFVGELAPEPEEIGKSVSKKKK